MPNVNNLIVPQELLVLGASVKTGLLDILKERRLNPGEISNLLDLDERSVRMVLEAMHALGYIDKNNDGYSLSKEAYRLFYEPDAPDYIGFGFMHRYGLLKKWLHLPDILQSGKPYPRSNDPMDTKYFIEAMAYNTRKYAVMQAEFLIPDIKVKLKILDIGGGPLIHAVAFKERNADVSVLDLPDVIRMKEIEAKSYNITMIAGDFTGQLPEGPYDLTYLGNICHIIGEDENRLLFEKVYRILNPAGRIVICDFIRNQNPAAALFGVNMLVNTEMGDTWTLQQYSDWLKSAGFGNIQYHIIAERELIIAIK